MRMHLGLVAVDGDVAVEREHLDLLLHGDLEVVFLVAVEVAERASLWQWLLKIPHHRSAGWHKPQHSLPNYTY